MSSPRRSSLIRHQACALVFCAAFASASFCDVRLSSAQEENALPAELKVEPSSLELRVGESANLTAEVKDKDGQVIDVPVLFFSRARQALTVSRDGNVKAIEHGEFEVVARTPRNPDRSRLQIVIPVVVAAPALEKIEIGRLGPRLYVGTSMPFEVKVIDVAGNERDDVKVEIASENPEIATVDPVGQIHFHGKGTVAIHARVGDLKQSIAIATTQLPVSSLDLELSTRKARTGDVVNLTATARDADGNVVTDVPIDYSFRQVRSGELLSIGGTGQIDPAGKFVAERDGMYQIHATCGPFAASGMLQVEPRNVQQQIELVGRGKVNEVHTSDLWVWEGSDGRDYAVTGTWGANGDALFWDVTDPENIERISSVRVDARTVNDVKVSEDGKICVISREGASSRKNGIVMIDVENPREPQVISEYTEGLTGGVHNLFIYEDHVYAVNNGRRYDVISIKDPAAPTTVGRFELTTPGHALHDVWIVDGLAYSSNWGDGLYIVDVGNGIAGGSPAQPIPVESYVIPNGAHHAAFPYENKLTGHKYVVCGDERFPYGLSVEGKPTIAGGYLHFVDVTTPGEPKEVARYEVPEAGSHNFWVDGDRLYVAMYNGGFRVVDMSGELMGDLYRQGREIARFLPHDPEGYIPNASMVWGPQPHKGVIFFSDWNTGLWAVRMVP